jgi:integrase
MKTQMKSPRIGTVKDTSWAQNQSKWPADCTPHPDGWTRWYKGKARWVCGKRVPLDEVEDRWIAVKQKVDAEENGQSAPVVAGTVHRTYREVLTEFLGLQKSRIGAARKPLAERSYFNYVTELNKLGNFVVGGRRIADMDIRQIGPTELTAYAATVKWKASGFDSVVSRVGALFRWAIQMEYLDRFRPGPEFVRPAKGELRSDRIELEKCYTAEELAKLYDRGNDTLKAWIALGCCAAFNNADIANLTYDVIDLSTGIIDFRRRKTGKIRRVIPLPVDVVALLRRCQRPSPTAPDATRLFFITRSGNPYTRQCSSSGKFVPTDSISRMFAKLIDAAGIETDRGQNFSGIRTTFRNLAPRGGYDTEREIIMGHAQGSIDYDSYLEDVGMDRLRFVVDHVWGKVKAEVAKPQQRTSDIAASDCGDNCGLKRVDGRDGV